MPGDDRTTPSGANPGYAAYQLTKALDTRDTHADPETRRRAAARVTRWETVLRDLLTGAVDHGSRAPLENVPEWVTLEVMTGGFATGNLVAGGPLQPHELALLEELSKPPKGRERAALNAHFVSEPGLAELGERLRAGTYDVTVPEEGALLTVAWLVRHGHVTQAHALLDQLLPLFDRVRFYPVPRSGPPPRGPHVHLQTVGDTVADLDQIQPNRKVLAQKEAVEIWAPFHDRVVSMFCETVVDDWPCRHYPPDWKERARALIDEYSTLRAQHVLCSKPDRRGGHQLQLRTLLQQCAEDPAALDGRAAGMVRRILRCFSRKRGAPGSAACAQARARQAEDVRAPVFAAIAQLVVARLNRHPGDAALADV